MPNTNPEAPRITLPHEERQLSRGPLWPWLAAAAVAIGMLAGLAPGAASHLLLAGCGAIA